MNSPIAVLFRRLGPYHVARLETLAAHLGSSKIAAIETSDIDSTYAWNPIGRTKGFSRYTLFHGQAELFPPAQLWFALHALLERIRPRAVAIPGWSDPLALGGLCWARRNRTPVILMSDSRAGDKRRSPWKESMKAAVVRLADAALVAGKAHASYVAALGMPSASILTGYDVVDNAHFAEGANLARTRAAEWRRMLELPERYFLAASRFVGGKGLSRVIRSYARYRANTGSDAWNLVLMGDGPLREELLALVARLNLQACVKFVGFRQYEELPLFYGLASAFVHASITDTWGLVINEAMASGLPVLVSQDCGCAAELVSHGETGWTFDPRDESELAKQMMMISRLSDQERSHFSEAAQRRMGDWSLNHFAEQFERALLKAQAARRKTRSYEQPLLRTIAWYRYFQEQRFIA